MPRVLAAFGLLAGLGVVLLSLLGPPPDPSAGQAKRVKLRAAVEQAGVSANIRRDSHGIPHILADDFKGMGFGYGYAFAEDNLCTMADTYITVRAERSRYFGKNGSYLQAGNGVTANNLNSDVFYQRIIDKGIIENLLDEPAPTGPADEIVEGVRGYVAGYNKYLADTGVDNLPDARCRGEAWVKPIEEIDAYRRFYQLALLASQSVAINGIGSEKFPGADAGVFDPNDLINTLEENFPLDLGSNAYGLGSEATDNGKGIVLGNPHFPWDGPERFYQAHLTIPGEVNVSGASLYGVPLVLIGHTDNLAWSHTVSTAFRFTPFQETLVPGQPTTYLYDGTPTPMTEDEVTVEADPGTNADDETRTVYSTHHGPVFTDLLGIPLPWGPTTAFAMGDVNAANFRYLNHFFEVNKAQSVQELDDIEEEFQGIPWVNTIAADSTGEAYYADIGAVPHVTDEKASGGAGNPFPCNTAAGAATFAALGLPILDGTRADCEWGSDPDAAGDIDGIFGYDNMPKIFRNDYVTNSNDSYWLSNPEAPLEGYNRIIGDERTERALRTRIGLKMIIERFGNGPSQPATDKLNRQDVQNIVFNNRQYAGELWRDELVAHCEADLDGMMAGVDVSEACDVLGAWDVRDDKGSRGAILFRRFVNRLSSTPGGLVSDPTIYDVGFNFNDAVNTPSGLNTTPGPAATRVEQALADAVTDLGGAGIDLDDRLGDHQYEIRDPDGGGPIPPERIEIHGGPGGVGVFNALNVNWNAGSGYPNVPHGSSFVIVTQFKDPGTNPCGADDRTILTYSQSDNPSSPYFADQTRMYSDKEWVNPPFCDNEVAAANLDETPIQGCLPAGCGTTGGGGSGGGTGTSGAASGNSCVTVMQGTRRGDRLVGTDQSERIRGRHGNDRIRGAGGEDCLHGGSGNDRINSADGGPDKVRCGRGADKVRADPVDSLRGCEVRR